MLFRLSGKMTLYTDKNRLDKQHLNLVNNKRAVILTCHKGQIETQLKLIFSLYLCSHIKKYVMLNVYAMNIFQTYFRDIECCMTCFVCIV